MWYSKTSHFLNDGNLWDNLGKWEKNRQGEHVSLMTQHKMTVQWENTS